MDVLTCARDHWILGPPSLAVGRPATSASVGMYTGQGAAGRGAFAYNTNTGAGIAARNNNVFASKDGTVYRYDRQSSNWSQNSGNGWHSASKSQPGLQQQQQPRIAGQERTQNFSRSMGAGMRGGGGRRK
jgi:hypothetical protein